MATIKTQEIDISKVYLDNNNPRHDPIDNEPEVIAYRFGPSLAFCAALPRSRRGKSPLIE